MTDLTNRFRAAFDPLETERLFGIQLDPRAKEGPETGVEHGEEDGATCNRLGCEGAIERELYSAPGCCYMRLICPECDWRGDWCP